jgi:hypothetical protein
VVEKDRAKNVYGKRRKKQTGVTHSMKGPDFIRGSLWGKSKREVSVGMRAKIMKRKNMRKFPSQYSKKERGREGKDSSNVVLNGIKKR